MSHISDPDTDEQHVLYLDRTVDEDAKTDECEGARTPTFPTAVAVRQRHPLSKVRTKMRRGAGLGWYRSKILYRRIYEAGTVLSAEVEEALAKILFRRGVVRLTQAERIAFERYKSILSVFGIVAALLTFLFGVELYNYALL